MNTRFDNQLLVEGVKPQHVERTKSWWRFHQLRRWTYLLPDVVLRSSGYIMMTTGVVFVGTYLPLACTNVVIPAGRSELWPIWWVPIAISGAVIGYAFRELGDRIRHRRLHHLGCARALGRSRIASSIDTLEQLLKSGGEFGLYLRGFGGERLVTSEEKPWYMKPTPPATTAEMYSSPAPERAEPRKFDEQFQKVYEEGMTIFSLGNVNDPSPPGFAMPVFCDDETWRRFAMMLIRDAATVVVYVSDWSDGIREELNMIKEQQRLADSSIIVSNSQLSPRIERMGFPEPNVVLPDIFRYNVQPGGAWGIR